MSENLFDTVCAALRTELGLSAEVTIDAADQLDLLPSADSVRLMRTVSRLEGLLGIEIDDWDIRSAQTVGDLVALTEAAQGPVVRTHA
jgi:acyl carrier protein